MSQIAPNNINGNFPVYGQDNPTQGFRDNFTNIKNNFTIAKTEIEDLQDKAILKSPLIGTVLDNDLNGSILTNPQLRAWTQAFIDLGSLAGPTDIDFNIGNFQKITTQGNIEINIVNWPASQGVGVTGYAVMRLWFVVTDVTHTVTLPPEVSVGTDDLADFDAGTNSLRFDVPGNFVLDISSADGGLNYLIFDNTRNRVRFRDPSFYFNPDISPTLLIGFNEFKDEAVALETGQDTVSIRGSYNSVQFAGADFPTIGDINGIQSTDYGPMPGYSITGLRVNVESGDIVGIKNHDHLGYINSVSFTGDGATGNVGKQFTAIGFYATGTDLTNGLGGNIAIFTGEQGTKESSSSLKQSIGFESDQSVNTYGALVTHNGEVSGNYQFKDLDSSANVLVSERSAVVLLDSGTASTIARANITMPPNIATMDGQRMTIASNCAITAVNFVSSTTTAWHEEVYYLGQTLIRVDANPNLHVGMTIYSTPEYVSGQTILEVRPDVPTAGITTLIISANADVGGAEGVTNITVNNNVRVNGKPTSFSPNTAYHWLFRRANDTWYKI
jgi:hypothetical protein